MVSMVITDDGLPLTMHDIYKQGHLSLQCGGPYEGAPKPMSISYYRILSRARSPRRRGPRRGAPRGLDTCINMCTRVHVYMYTCMCIYIYRERERARGRDR